MGGQGGGGGGDKEGAFACECVGWDGEIRRECLHVSVLDGTGR